MCGIIGYLGDKAVDRALLKALSRFEYRGYDSAGMPPSVTLRNLR